jgi:Arc/MetJ-type ribon-helix-helix transcriptional regulator
MSKQIAVRLPEELVDFVDQIVDSGTGRSRASVVTKALERERRRVIAARDAQILARTGLGLSDAADPRRAARQGQTGARPHS